jgi:hypothetical protein
MKERRGENFRRKYEGAKKRQGDMILHFEMSVCYPKFIILKSPV